MVKAVFGLYGDQESTIELTGLRGTETMHQKPFLPLEGNVVSDLKSDSSEYGERLSIEEIKDWLIGCQE